MNTPDPTERFGLVAWLEATRVVLPLKGVECRFEVTGGVASVELDQIYHQENAAALDCTYLFPLPAEAAVYRCELIVNGRVIRAIVQEKQEARIIYEEQKAAGHRVAMVENERENLFTLSLGNVQPGDVVVVRLAWFQVLDRLGDGLRLLVPTCPGVRYIPGKPLLRGNSGRGTEGDTDEVPDASRITPPRIEALHPEAAYFALSGRLSPADVASGTASSPTHAVLVREGESGVTVELADRGTVPDQDFVLTWREPVARTLAPQAWRWESGEENYALVQLRAPAEVAVAENVAQDFYFLVDRSGSMQGRKWVQTCRALREFVALLGAEDRVWITFFESAFQDYAERPLPAPQVRADAAFHRLVEQGTAGGTELLPAAGHVLAQITRHSPGRTATVVLITDGEVGNEAAIIAAFGRAPEVRVHTFGIDTTVNDAFLKKLAREHRGGCWLQAPNDDIAGTVAALAGQLRRPVITQLEMGAGWEAGGQVLPDLYAGQVATLALRGARGTALEISGRLANGEAHRFAVPLEAAGTCATALLWARERMATLLAARHQREAVALAKQHNLLCEGAVFIAWDEAEKVTVAIKEVVQPALEPLRCNMMADSWDTLMALQAACPPERLLGDHDAELAESRLEGLWRARLVRWLPEVGFPKERMGTLRAAIWGGDDPELQSGAVKIEARIEQLYANAFALKTCLDSLDLPAAREAAAEFLRRGMVTVDDVCMTLSLLAYGFRRVRTMGVKLCAFGMPAEKARELSEWVLADRGTICGRQIQADEVLQRLQDDSDPDSAATPEPLRVVERWHVRLVRVLRQVGFPEAHLDALKASIYGSDNPAEESGAAMIEARIEQLYVTADELKNYLTSVAARKAAEEFLRCSEPSVPQLGRTLGMLAYRFRRVSSLHNKLCVFGASAEKARELCDWVLADRVEICGRQALADEVVKRLRDGDPAELTAMPELLNRTEEPWHSRLAPVLREVGFPEAHLGTLKASIRGGDNPAEESGAARIKSRIELLSLKVEACKTDLESMGLPAAREAAEEYLRRGVRSEAQLRWTLDMLADAFTRVSSLRNKLRMFGASVEVAREISEWVLADRVDICGRQLEARVLLRSLQSGPMKSAESVAELWRELREKTAGQSSPAIDGATPKA